jgi:hypothetical protein
MVLSVNKRDLAYFYGYFKCGVREGEDSIPPEPATTPSPGLHTTLPKINFGAPKSINYPMQ